MTRLATAVLGVAALAACKPPVQTQPPQPESKGPTAIVTDVDVRPSGEGTKERVPEDLGELLDEVRRRSAVPGLAAAVVDDAGVLAIGVSGQRRADEPAPLTPQDRFHLGSNTKAMTAVLYARLVDAGVLRWDLRVADAFDGDVIHENFREVTMTQLMRHRAGVPPNALDVKGLQVELGKLPEKEHRAAVTARVLADGPRSTPGSKFVYSNLGYVVVGSAIERATNKRWENAVREYVFDPLHMTSCGFGPTATGDARDQPWAHADLGDAEAYRPVDFDNPSFMGPAATVHCSLEDWGKFAAVFFEGSTFVTSGSLDELVSAVPLDDARGGGYALGWAVPDATEFDLPILTHDGSNTINYASITIMPTLRAAVMVAANAGGKRAQQAVVATTIELVRSVRGPTEPTP